MKKIFILSLTAVLLLAFSVVSFAHTTSHSSVLNSWTDEYGRVIVGGEAIAGTPVKVGWYFCESSHLGTNNATYYFDGTVTDFCRNRFNGGVALWENYSQANLTETTSTNANILVSIGAHPSGSNAYAFARPISSSGTGNGHYSQWEIVINENRQSAFRDHIAAHEIGHVFGLLDLPTFTEALMYHQNTGDVTAPTSYDVMGFNVATGLHTSHSWSYNDWGRFCVGCGGPKTEYHEYWWQQYNATSHKGVCHHCSGGQYSIVYEPHTYHMSDPSTGICDRCGYVGRSIEINSDEEIAIE